ncbi:MAG TPA: hypothetical protein VMR52_02100 [Dehalococcoidia bacterium]|nr:hypothetical protein [Dehalococcoidia bacterium]
MKFRQHVASAVIRACVTLLLASFLLALLFHFWPSSAAYLLT